MTLDLFWNALASGSWPQLAVASGILFAALLLIVVLVRRRASERIDQLEAEAVALHNQLTNVTNERDDLLKRLGQSGPAAPTTVGARARWSGSEIATVLSAVTALVLGIGGLYISSQKQALSEALKRVEALGLEADTLKATLDTARRELVPATMGRWVEVSRRDVRAYSRSATLFVIDGERASGCPTQKVSYAGTDPGVLDIPSGPCRIDFLLKEPARLTLQYHVQRAKLPRQAAGG
jgi:hypothetical protein